MPHAAGAKILAMVSTMPRSACGRRTSRSGRLGHPCQATDPAPERRLRAPV